MSLEKLNRSRGVICARCASVPQRAIGLLADRARVMAERVKRLDLACEHCIGCSRTLTNYQRDQQVKCVNLNCHLLYMRQVALETSWESNNEVSDAMKQLSLQMDW